MDSGAKKTGNRVCSERALQSLAAIKIFQESAIKQLEIVRSTNGAAAEMTCDSIAYQLSRAIELTDTIIKDIAECRDVNEPTIVSTALYDHVFREFKCDSSQRLITIKDKRIIVPEAEWVFLYELIKSPNRPIAFEKNHVARTNISRIKQRIPELKDLITSKYGSFAYTLAVTPIR